MRNYLQYVFLLLLGCLHTTVTTAQDIHQNQQERILDFDVLLTFDKQGVLTVEETIKVLVKGNKIKRGIFRKLPLYRKERNGEEQNVAYQIKKILYNNEPTNYFENEIGDDLAIKIS